jgi:hypothetical protein
MAERWLPVYEAFSAREGWGDPAHLRRSLGPVAGADRDLDPGAFAPYTHGHTLAAYAHEYAGAPDAHGHACAAYKHAAPAHQHADALPACAHRR